LKLKATRMVEAEFDSKEEGICFNESVRAKWRVTVKAGNKMCSVGMIRRSRSWGDYGGVYCAECLYFTNERCVGEPEEELCGREPRKQLREVVEKCLS